MTLTRTVQSTLLAFCLSLRMWADLLSSSRQRMPYALLCLFPEKQSRFFFHCGMFSLFHLRTAGPVQRSVRRSPPVWLIFVLDSCHFCPAGQLQPIGHLLGEIVVRAPDKKHDGMSNVACWREVKGKKACLKSQIIAPHMVMVSERKCQTNVAGWAVIKQSYIK